MTILQFRSEGVGGSGSGPFYNIIHVSTSDGAEQATVDGVAGLLKTFYDTVVTQCPTSVAWQAAERVTSVASPPTIYTPTALPGKSVGSVPDALPPQNACVISWRTSKAGSRYRGRTYLGPLGDGILNPDGTFKSTVAAAFLSAAQALLTGIPALDIGGGAAFLGIYSRKYSTIETVTGVAVDTKVDTQRRRN